jgi:protoheme ferro-lyase
MKEVLPIRNKFGLFLRSILFGLVLICFLAFKGNIERIAIIFITLIFISFLTDKKFSNIYFTVFLGGIILGYTLGNLILYYYTNNFDTPYNSGYQINKHKDPKVAVMIVGEGESPTYDFSVVLKNIYNNGNWIKKILAPIEAFKYKLAYEKAGKSIYNDLCKEISNKLQILLGPEYDIHSSFLHVTPNIYNELAALGKRYDKIILAPLLLNQSKEYINMEEKISEIALGTQSQIEIIPLLWQSEKLARQMVMKIAKQTKIEARGLTGVIVLRSDKKINLHQENGFITRFIKNMKKHGYDVNKVLTVDFIDSKSIKIGVHKLQERGINKVIVVSMSSLIDDVSRQWKIDNIVKDISSKEQIKIIYINGWGIGENLLNELEINIRLSKLKDFK